MFNSRVSKSLLYESVVEKLTEMIDRGIVSPGGQFPTERELVESMEVSRNVLREAFHILEEKGIVLSIQGKGRFLRKLPDKYMPHPTTLEFQRYSLLELYQVRIVLEQGAMDILAESASDSDFDEIEATFRELSAVFKENRKTLGEFRMHMAYAERTHNDYLLSLLKETIDRVFRIMWGDFSTVASTYDVDSFISDHTKILAALRRRDSNEARFLMREHLSQTSHSIENFTTNNS